jgi:glyoxylase-like metal-dependent hydrolase (beta-lactamase superfamily II)
MQKVGDVEIHVLTDGFFRLDGGAMFGIVPRPAWEKKMPCDACHRVRLSLNPLLIRSGGKNVVVDSGIGGRDDAKFVNNYAIERARSLPDCLRSLGLSPGDVDAVVPSHLHFDHAGWLTTRQPGGAYAPTFPRARYVVQEGTWEEALESNPRTRGSYIETDFLPVERQLEAVRGQAEVAPGVWVEATAGHVKHHQIVRVRSKGRQAVYFGDLLPTTAHLRPAWVMGYDLYPKEVAALKEKMVEQAVREEWLVCLDHDPRHAIVRLERDGTDVKAVPVEAVAA